MISFRDTWTNIHIHLHTHIHVYTYTYTYTWICARIVQMQQSSVHNQRVLRFGEFQKKKEPEKRKEPCHLQRRIITMPSAPQRAFAGAVPFSALLHSFCVRLWTPVATNQYSRFVDVYGPCAAAARRGGELVDGLVSQLLGASAMRHNCVSERCDLVACSVLRGILYCTEPEIQS